MADKLYVVVIAAGKGTRMYSEHSKLVQKIHNKEMIKRVIQTAEGLNPDKIICVVGYKKDEVKAALNGFDVSYVLQEEQLGTGHAVMQAIPEIDEKGRVVILYGDVPLIRKETISNFINSNMEKKEAVTILTAEVPNPTGYGRILRDSFGNIFDIREEKDCTDEEKKVTEINAGMYCFDSEKLKYSLSRITNNNASNEYYLTDTAKVLVDATEKVGTYTVKDNVELLGVNDRIQLEIATKLYTQRKNIEYMKSGVTIEDTNNVYIEDDVVIGKDTVIKPGVVIKEGATIGENCILGYNVYIGEGKTVKPGTVVKDNAII